MTLPDVSDEIGEDPRRFLDVGRDPADLRLAKARINGIDKIDVLRGWIEVEAAIGPRPTVMGWLRDRNQTLLEIGERPDRNTYRETPDPDEIEKKPARFLDEDGNEYTPKPVSYTGLRSRDTGRSTSSRKSSSASDKSRQVTLAASGGSE